MPLNGYNDKMHVLLAENPWKAKAFEFQSERFEKIKELVSVLFGSWIKCAKEYSNFDMAYAYRRWDAPMQISKRNTVPACCSFGKHGLQNQWAKLQRKACFSCMCFCNSLFRKKLRSCLTDLQFPLIDITEQDLRTSCLTCWGILTLKDSSTETWTKR